MQNSIVLDKGIKFALRIVGVYKHLTDEKKEFVLSRQLLLSGSFVVKHIKSALHSKGKFASEMSMALQKALEVELWLLLLKEGDWLTQAQHDSLHADCVEIIKMTSAISKTARPDD